MDRHQTLTPLTLTLSPHWGEGNKDGAFLNPLASSSLSSPPWGDEAEGAGRIDERPTQENRQWKPATQRSTG